MFDHLISLLISTLGASWLRIAALAFATGGAGVALFDDTYEKGPWGRKLTKTGQVALATLLFAFSLETLDQHEADARNVELRRQSDGFMVDLGTQLQTATQELDQTRDTLRESQENLAKAQQNLARAQMDVRHAIQSLKKSTSTVVTSGQLVSAGGAADSVIRTRIPVVDGFGRPVVTRTGDTVEFDLQCHSDLQKTGVLPAAEKTAIWAGGRQIWLVRSSPTMRGAFTVKGVGNRRLPIYISNCDYCEGSLTVQTHIGALSMHTDHLGHGRSPSTARPFQTPAKPFHKPSDNRPEHLRDVPADTT